MGTEPYDTYRRWTGVGDWAGGGATCGYDADGNVVSVTTPGGTTHPGGVVDTRALDGNDGINGPADQHFILTIARKRQAQDFRHTGTQLQRLAVRRLTL